MILSIQSHVSYGYVGNRVATFILQRMGFEVVTINTVQFSNHTGYGRWKGEVFGIDHLQNILQGLDDVGTLQQCQALLSGYLGSLETADVVTRAFCKLREYNEDALYVCDPVMGDVGRGLFVREGIPVKFKQDVVQYALCLTPNLFELEILTDCKITTVAGLKKAMDSLANPIVIVTSVDLPELDPTQIYMLMRYRGDFFFVHAPKLTFDVSPNGAGDAVSALFLGHYLKTGDPHHSLEKTNTAMHYLFHLTHKRGCRELALIQAQEFFG